MKPGYSANTVNQTVSVDGGATTWRASPGQDWVQIGGTGSSATSDPMALAAQAQQMQLTANQPAIATLTSQKTDLASKYQDLLDSITTAEQPAIDVATAQGNAANAARGITPTSELGIKNISGITTPITAAFGTSLANVGVAEQQDLDTLAGQIASLQAGNVGNALSFASGITGAEQTAQSSIQAAQIAANKPQVISGGQALVSGTGGTIAGNTSLNLNAFGTNNNNLGTTTQNNSAGTKTPVTSLVTPITPIPSLALNFGSQTDTRSAILK